MRTDPFAALDDDTTTPTSAERGFFDEVDSPDDWFEDHTQPEPKPDVTPELPQAPVVKRVIDVNSTPEEEYDAFDPEEVSAEDFDDFTPRRPRFAAPKAEDVLLSPTKQGKSHKKADAATSATDRKAAKRAEKLERRRQQQERQQEEKQRNLDSRQERQAEKDRRRQERQAEKDRRRQERQANTEKASTNNADASTMFSGGKVIAALVLALLLIIGFAAWGLLQATSSGDSEKPQQNQEQAEQQAAPAGTPESRLDSVVASTCERAKGTFENGDGSTPEGAIKAFNHAYFKVKDAKVASKFLSPAMYKSVPELQKGIDDPQNGDGYCLTIAPSDRPNEYKVGLTEFVKPATADGEVVSWRTDQIITVEKHQDAWRISKQVINSR